MFEGMVELRAGSTEVVAAEAPPTKKIKTSGGGSPYQLFQNQRMSSAKQLAVPSQLTPRGAMTATFREQVIRESRAAWQALPADERALYKDMFNNRMRERREEAGQRQAQEAQQEASESESLSSLSAWGCGGNRTMVHPNFVRKAFEQGQGLPPLAEVFDDSEYLMTGMSEAGLLGQDVIIDACGVQGRNLCRLDGAIELVDKLAAVVSALTSRLGIAEAQAGDILLKFSVVAAAGPMGQARPSANFFALLSGCSFNPKFQDLTLCEGSVDGIWQEEVAAPIAYPLELRLAISHTRLILPGRPVTECFKHTTSDEFFKRLALAAPCWQVAVVEYDMVAACRMRVMSAGERLRGSTLDHKGKRPKVRQDKLLIEALRMGGADDDPFAKGRVAGGTRARSSGSGSASGATARSASIPEDVDELPGATSIDDDDEVRRSLPLSALTAPQLDSALVELTSGEFLPDDNDSAEEEELPLGDEPLAAQVAGSGAPADQSSSSGDGGIGMVAATASPPPDVGASLASVAQVSAACSLACEVLEEAVSGMAAPQTDGDEASTGAEVASASAEPSAASSSSALPPPPVAEPSLGDHVPGGPAGWTMTAKRMVFSPERRFAGHLTGWGGKSMSMKCVAHDGKCNIAVNSQKFTVGQLVEWLATAKNFPGRERKDEHRAVWKSMACDQ